MSPKQLTWCSRSFCSRVLMVQVFGGAQSNGEPSRVIDAEFAFIPNDNIITLRAASRVQPSGFEGKLKLSFTDSPLVLDANYSK